MQTTNPDSLDPKARQTLLTLARRSIRHGLDTGTALRVEPNEFEAPLRALRASFVTLNRQGMLRGCIGHLEATLPLVEDVAENAFAAAFRDPRFTPLSAPEFDDLELHISVLTPAEPLSCESEADLLKQMRPFKDGLILAQGHRQGTFLPSVWEQLPEPEDFLRHLKRKAGLPDDYWSPSLEIFRYETESFP
ncbi:MAG: AmmeMemoRadiSam system protein A [Candidatus Thiodiazotropha sp.]